MSLLAAEDEGARVMSEMNGDDQAILPFDDGSAGRLIRRVWHEGRWYFSVVV